MQMIETKTRMSGPMQIETTVYSTAHTFHGYTILLKKSASTLNGRTLVDWWVTLEGSESVTFIGTFRTAEKALAFYSVAA